MTFIQTYIMVYHNLFLDVYFSQKINWSRKIGNTLQ